MSGTRSTAGDVAPVTRLPQPVRRRVAAAALLILALTALFVWMSRAAWRQMRQVGQQFTAIQTESFYLGVYLRGGIWKLNSRVLRFQLSRDETERDDFHREARDLNDWIAKTKPALTTPEQRDLVRRVENAFNQYLTDVAPLLEQRLGAIRKDSTSLIHQQLVEKSEPLLKLCESLVRTQHEALDQCFSTSGAALSSLRSLLLLYSVYFFALVIAIAILIYQVLVIPMQRRLSQTQDAIERQEKLASLGGLAAGVAHEIRNPLTAMKLRLFSLKKEFPEILAKHEDLAVIQSEISRLERIVQEFLQFARPAEPRLEEVPAAAIMQQVYDLLKPQLQRQGIDLTLEIANPARVRADRQQIQQVLINLVQNGGESIGRNGAIHLRLKSGVASLAGNSTPVVLFEVADTGKGIPPEVEARLFDPFFSTKEGGTGLGLSTAARIAGKHDGVLQYHSQFNRGATFTLVLPRITDHASQTAAY